MTTGAPPPEAVRPDEACAQQLVAALPPARRAAQLLVVGLPADVEAPGPEVRRAVGGLGVGGLILTGRSDRGVEATAALTDAVRGLRPPDGPQPLVAVDQEGGAVQVLSGPGFSDIPAAREQGRLDPAVLRRRAAGWAAELAAAGVDLDLAPVADVVPEGTDNAPVGRFGRGYGATPQEAAEDVAAFVRGMREAGVQTAVKHFPGLGRATGNTDDTAGVVDTVTGPQDPALAPFRAGTRAGAQFVMMSSATYQRIDPEQPALFSPTVLRLARSVLDGPGVVMSDDVGAAQALADVPVGERARRFVVAGGDLVLTVRPDDAPAMVAALVAAAADPAVADRLAQAAQRVVAVKVRAGLVGCPA